MSVDIPYAVAVGGDHLEAVPSRRDAVIRGRTARARVDPALVEAHKPVLEPDLVGLHEAERRVVGFEAVAVWRHFDAGVAGNHRSAAHAYVLDANGRRMRIGANQRGRDLSDASLRRQPERSVGHPQAGRLTAPIALESRQAVDDAEPGSPDCGESPLGELAQIRLADPRDPSIAAHPEVAPAVVEDLEDAVVVHAVPRRVPRQPGRLPAGTIRRHRCRSTAPSRPRTARGRGCRPGRRVRIAGKPAVLQAAEAAARADPELRLTTAEQRCDAVVNQAVGRRVPTGPCSALPHQAVVCSEPEGAALVFMDGPDASAKPPHRVRVSRDAFAADHGEPGLRPDQQSTRPVFEQRRNPIARQAIGDTKCGIALVAEPVQPVAPRADPDPVLTIT